MARSSKPWFRASKRQWYTTMHGDQIPLGVTDPKAEAAAWAALHRLLSGGGVPPPARPPAPTVREAVARWLAEVTPYVRPRTAKIYAANAERFARLLGDRRCDETLTVADVLAGAARPTWGDSMKRQYLDACFAVLKAVGWQPPNGQRVRRPRRRSAGPRMLITPEQHWQVVGATGGDFRQYVRGLWELGCRPQELAGLTCEQVRWGEAVAVLQEHKTSSKTGRPRTLYFSEACLKVLSAQRDRHKGGHLFRATHGRPFTPGAIVSRFCHLSRRLGFPVCAYSYRHTAITRLLRAGVPAAQVAELVGNSIVMIERHYAHLSGAPELHAAANKLSGMAG